MKIYFAPLEGITGYMYRNTFHRHFGGVDRYFIPFIQPKQHGHFSTREKKDIMPEHNQGMQVVPQLLTNQAADFLQTARQLAELGYEEVNLNLGCPSRTVVSKGRGAGQLKDVQVLGAFLDEIFKASPVRISIKTRIGLQDPEEFDQLLAVFMQYPLTELIIHPRVQQEYYEGQPHIETFLTAYQQLQNAARSGGKPFTLCYNGDIFSKADYQRLVEKAPALSCIMLGRGLLRNPGLAEQLKGKEAPEKERLRAFHDDLYRQYQEEMSGERNVLFKMKEFWVYMAESFEDSRKYAKKIKKAQRLRQYEEAVQQIFEMELKQA